MSALNPCMTCGACCAYFRVSFYWAEGDDADGRVPASLTEPVTPFLRCMAGTNQKQPHCKALLGKPGESVSCAISPFMKIALLPAANFQCQAKVAK